MLFKDLRELGDCGEDLLGIAVNSLHCFCVGHVITRTNVLVIRLETAADQACTHVVAIYESGGKGEKIGFFKACGVTCEGAKEK